MKLNLKRSNSGRKPSLRDSGHYEGGSSLADEVATEEVQQRNAYVGDQSREEVRTMAFEAVEGARQAMEKEKKKINAKTKELNKHISAHENELTKLKSEIEVQTEEMIKLDAKWISNKSKKQNVRFDEANWKTERKNNIKLIRELERKNKELDAKEMELDAKNEKLKTLEKRLKLESEKHNTLKLQIKAVNIDNFQNEKYKKMEASLQLERQKNSALETQIANYASTRIDDEVDTRDDNTYFTRDDGGNSIAQAGVFAMLFRACKDDNKSCLDVASVCGGREDV